MLDKTKTTAKPDTEPLAAFSSEWDLIPLHKPFATSTRKGVKRKDGKRPLGNDWARRKLLPREQLLAKYGERHNIGVRLRATQLILDVDKRSGGLKSLKALKAKLGLDLDNVPCAITGAGGYHFYFLKPDDGPVLDSLEAFPGLEFKSKGRQCVCPGSVHPETGAYYVWDELAPPLEQISDAPQALLDLIRRPAIPKDQPGAGAIAPEDLPAMLKPLEPEDYRDHDKWLHLMMACHHGTAGDGREEFIDWSTGDFKYADDRGDIGRRWDSLSAERPEGMVTVATLYKALVDADRADLLPAPSPLEDFAEDVPEEWTFPRDSIIAKVRALKKKTEANGCTADEAASAEAKVGELMELYGIGEEETSEEEEKGDPMVRMSREYHAVVEGNRFSIMRLRPDPNFPGQHVWDSLPQDHFLKSLQNIKVEAGFDALGFPKTEPIGKAWLAWGGRKTAQGTTIDPNAPAGALVGGRGKNPGALNLWMGWGVKSIKGNCSKLLDYMLNVLCRGSVEKFNYLHNWLAWKIQNPGLMPEVTITMVGKKGAGKSTLGKIMVKLFGAHGMVLNTAMQIAGRFTGHLAQICFLFADEAMVSGDKTQEGVLKQTITDARVPREAKGKDIVPDINRLGVMTAANDKGSIRATPDERRHFVLGMSSDRIAPQDAPKDHPNRLYWDALYHELDHGGYEAFLYHLQHHKLPKNWHPRVGGPVTQELTDEIVHGLEGVAKWWHETLLEGELGLDALRTESISLAERSSAESTSWAEKSLRILPSKLTSIYVGWCKRNRLPSNCSERALFAVLKDYGVKRSKSHNPRLWIIPDLNTARAAFEKVIGGNLFD